MIQQVISYTPSPEITPCPTGVIQYSFFVETRTETSRFLSEPREVHVYDFDSARGTDPVEALREKRLRELYTHDSSDRVNRFRYRSTVTWLDKATRVGLVNSLTCLGESGATSAVLWLDGTPVELPVEAAKNFLRDLEVYAATCYNVTATHAANLRNLTEVRDIFYYDVTANYPEPLVLTAE